MESNWILEFVGYAASVLIAVSLTMRSVLRLRLINLAGSSCFVAYGILIQAYPVALMNCAIVFINLYYLRELTQSKTVFSILESSKDSEYLDLFLNHYADEVADLFPAFDRRLVEGHVVWFILHGLVPVGLFLADTSKDRGLFVHMDYVIPGYRDLKPGKFLYTKQKDRFAKLGITRLCSAPVSSEQRKYLMRMGFTPAHDGDSTLCRSVG